MCNVVVEVSYDSRRALEVYLLDRIPAADTQHVPGDRVRRAWNIMFAMWKEPTRKPLLKRADKGFYEFVTLSPCMSCSSPLFATDSPTPLQRATVYGPWF